MILFKNRPGLDDFPVQLHITFKTHKTSNFFQIHSSTEKDENFYNSLYETNRTLLLKC